MNEVIGYQDIQDEVVDDNGEKEKEIIDAIETSLGEENLLAASTLESLTKDQLSQFLTNESFPDGGINTYSQISTLPYINFSLRAAFQMITKNNDEKFNTDGTKLTPPLSDNNDGKRKTPSEWLQHWGGITNEYNQDMVMFLQKIVGAHPDGKAGPQTIYKIIEKLDGAKLNLAEGVNNLYKGNEKFQVMRVGEYTHNSKTYKFDQDKIKNGDGNDGTYKFEFDYSGNLTTEGLKIDNGWIISDVDNSNDTIQGYKPSEKTDDQFDEKYSEGLLDILGQNKQDIVDFVKNVDKKYFGALLDPVFLNMIENLKPENVFVKLEGDNLKISLGLKDSDLSLYLYPFTFTISAASILDTDQNYSQTKLAKQLKDYLIGEYVKKQYENIPAQAKSKMYTIGLSSNVKINTFLVLNDFNNLNILNYAYIKDGFVMFNVPKTSDGKPIKDLDKLKGIKLDAKQIVKGNSVDMDKLKNLLDADMSKIIGVNINNLSHIKEREGTEGLSVLYKDKYFEFKDDITKNEFLRFTANSDDIKVKNNVLYKPPFSSESKDQLWYKVEDGEIYKFGKGNNWETAWVFDESIDGYKLDSQRDKHWSSVERFI